MAEFDLILLQIISKTPMSKHASMNILIIDYFGVSTFITTCDCLRLSLWVVYLTPDPVLWLIVAQ